MAGPRLRAAVLLATLGSSWGPVLWLAAPAATSPRTLADALASVLSWALLVGWGCWTAAIGSLAVELVFTGRTTRTRRRAPRAAKALVAAVCGAGALGALAGPAVADPIGGGAPEVHLLDGLALPDRVLDHAPDPSRSSPPHPTDRTVTVRPGDSLWAIAQGLDLEWGSLYAANRTVVGPDPDLIQPGQRLVVPSHTTHEGAHR